MATAAAVPAASSPPRAVTTLKARKEIIEFADRTVEPWSAVASRRRRAAVHRPTSRAGCRSPHTHSPIGLRDSLNT